MTESNKPGLGDIGMDPSKQTAADVTAGFEIMKDGLREARIDKVGEYDERIRAVQAGKPIKKNDRLEDLFKDFRRVSGQDWTEAFDMAQYREGPKEEGASAAGAEENASQVSPVQAEEPSDSSQRIDSLKNEMAENEEQIDNLNRQIEELKQKENLSDDEWEVFNNLDAELKTRLQDSGDFQTTIAKLEEGSSPDKLVGNQGEELDIPAFLRRRPEQEKIDEIDVKIKAKIESGEIDDELSELQQQRKELRDQLESYKQDLKQGNGKGGISQNETSENPSNDDIDLPTFLIRREKIDRIDAKIKAKLEAGEIDDEFYELQQQRKDLRIKDDRNEELDNQEEIPQERLVHNLDVDLMEVNNPENHKWTNKTFNWLQRNSGYRIATGVAVSALGASFGMSPAIWGARAALGAIGGGIGFSGLKAGLREGKILKKFNETFRDEEGNINIAEIEQKIQNGTLDQKDRDALIYLYAGFTEIASSKGRRIEESLDQEREENTSKIDKLFPKLKENKLVKWYSKQHWGVKAALGIGIAFGAGYAGGAAFGGAALAKVLCTGAAQMGLGLIQRSPDSMSETYSHSSEALLVKGLLERTGGLTDDELEAVENYREDAKKGRLKDAVIGGGVMAALIGGAAAYMGHQAEVHHSETQGDVDQNTNTDQSETPSDTSSDNNGDSNIEGSGDTGTEQSTDSGVNSSEQTQAETGSSSTESEQTGTTTPDISEQQTGSDTTGTDAGGEQTPAQPSSDQSSNAEQSSASTEGGQTDAGSSETNSAFKFGNSAEPASDAHTNAANAAEPMNISGSKVDLKVDDHMAGSDTLKDDITKGGAFDKGPGASDRMAVKIVEGLEGKKQITFSTPSERDQFVNGLIQEMKADKVFAPDGSLVNQDALGEVSPAQMAHDIAEKMNSGARFEPFVNHDQILAIQEKLHQPHVENAISNTGNESTVTSTTEIGTLDNAYKGNPEIASIEKVIENSDKAGFDKAIPMSKDQIEFLLDPKKGHLSDSVAGALRRELDAGRLKYEDIRISDSAEHHYTDVKIHLHNGDPAREFIGHQLRKPYVELDHAQEAARKWWNLFGMFGKKAENMEQTVGEQTSTSPVIETMKVEQADAPVVSIQPEVNTSQQLMEPKIENPIGETTSGTNAGEAGPVIKFDQPEANTAPTQSAESIQSQDSRPIGEQIDSITMDKANPSEIAKIRLEHPRFTDDMVLSEYKRGLKLDVIDQGLKTIEEYNKP